MPRINLTTKYAVFHTMDESGGRYFDDPCDLETHDLKLAKTVAETFTTNGQCGYVMRDDGLRLAPNGRWINEDGDEIA